MSLAKLIYLASMFGGLKAFFLTVTILSGIGVIPFVIISAIALVENDCEDVGAMSKKWLMRLVPFTLLCGLITAVLPTQTTVYVMAGASVAEDAFHSEVGNKIMTIINQKLDEEIKAVKQ